MRRAARPAPPRAGDLLPIEAITPDGLLVRSDGTLVRCLEVVPSNPLALDPTDCERMTRGFSELLARVPAGMSVQLIAQAEPVGLDALLGELRAEADAATQALLRDGDPLRRAQGGALRRLAACHEASLRLHAETQAAVRLRYLLVAPWRADVARRAPGALRLPARPASRGVALRRPLAVHQRLARESLHHADALRSALAGLEMSASLLDGPAFCDLIWRRLSPQRAAGRPDRAPSRHAELLLTDLDEPVTPEAAAERAWRLRAALAQAELDASDRRRLWVDGGLERTVYLAHRPERTFYGWLLHAMQHPRPWTLAVHVHVRDRAQERARQDRRARRLWGVNEGALDRRARPDRAQHEQQVELEELVEELSTGAQTLCDVSVYQALREPGPDPDAAALDEAVDSALRDLAIPVDSVAHPGVARQLDLWRSTLPLGLDFARRTMPLVSRNAADSVPYVSTSSGSPRGLPFAFAEPGRTLERLDPFDPLHDNGTTLIFAKSGGGKTTTTIALTSQALTRGCQVNVLDRSAGHYRFLCDLIPGATHVELGAEDGATVNPWDTPDPAAVPRSKVAFLVRLHALLVGDHDAGTDSYGLDPLERNLLALAIRATYQRAAAAQILPREALLRETLLELAEAETPEEAAAYRNLAHRLGEFTADGTYAYLFDQPTSVGAADAPLAVFNTRQVPDDVAAPLLFSVLELVSRRVQDRHERHQRRLAEGRQAAGPLDGSSCVVVEELWKLVERKATGAWVNELVKRARHIGLWFIAITQQRSDLAGPQGRALLDNSTIQLFLRNGPDDIAHIADALSLSDEETQQIAKLVTEKRSHAQAYLINGERGRGAVSIRLGPHVYWLATSDPVNDLPWRELALAEAGYRPHADEHERSAACFRALDLLADPAWHDARAGRA